MLDELYVGSAARLAGDPAVASDDRVASVRDGVAPFWKGSTEELDALLEALPPRYLLANRPESIAHHAQAIADRAGRAAHVARVPSRHPEAAELCVVADDRPGLLASIAAALAASRLEVLKAEVYSHPVGAEREALDLFWVRDRYGGIEEVEAALPGLARDLVEVCSSKVSPADLLRGRTGSGSPWSRRPSPAVATEIFFDNRSSPRHTIVEVYAKDRPGLLYALARAFHELTLIITVSKIHTEGSGVADVFYVSEADGTKVSTDARQEQVGAALRRAVDGG